MNGLRRLLLIFIVILFLFVFFLGLNQMYLMETSTLGEGECYVNWMKQNPSRKVPREEDSLIFHYNTTVKFRDHEGDSAYFDIECE